MRAEKGYYRLLYLEDEYRQQVAPGAQDPESTPYHWDRLTSILNQLRDLPELKTKLTDDIEAVSSAILSKV